MLGKERIANNKWFLLGAVGLDPLPPPRNDRNASTPKPEGHASENQARHRDWGGGQGNWLTKIAGITWGNISGTTNLKNPPK